MNLNYKTILQSFKMMMRHVLRIVLAELLHLYIIDIHSIFSKVY